MNCVLRKFFLFVFFTFFVSAQMQEYLYAASKPELTASAAHDEQEDIKRAKIASLVDLNVDMKPLVCTGRPLWPVCSGSQPVAPPTLLGPGCCPMLVLDAEAKAEIDRSVSDESVRVGDRAGDVIGEPKDACEWEAWIKREYARFVSIQRDRYPDTDPVSFELFKPNFELLLQQSMTELREESRRQAPSVSVDDKKVVVPSSSLFAPATGGSPGFVIDQCDSIYDHDQSLDDELNRVMAQNAAIVARNTRSMSTPSQAYALGCVDISIPKAPKALLPASAALSLPSSVRAGSTLATHDTTPGSPLISAKKESKSFDSPGRFKPLDLSSHSPGSPSKMHHESKHTTSIKPRSLFSSPVRPAKKPTPFRSPFKSPEDFQKTSEILEDLLSNLLTFQFNSGMNLNSDFFRAVAPLVRTMFFTKAEESRFKAEIEKNRVLAQQAKKEEKKPKKEEKQADPRKEFDGCVKKLNTLGDLHELLCRIIFEDRRSICEFITAVINLWDEANNRSDEKEGEKSTKRKTKSERIDDFLDKNSTRILLDGERLDQILCTISPKEIAAALNTMKENADIDATKMEVAAEAVRKKELAALDKKRKELPNLIPNAERARAEWIKNGTEKALKILAKAGVEAAAVIKIQEELTQMDRDNVGPKDRGRLTAQDKLTAAQVRENDLRQGYEKASAEIPVRAEAIMNTMKARANVVGQEIEDKIPEIQQQYDEAMAKVEALRAAAENYEAQLQAAHAEALAKKYVRGSVSKISPQVLQFVLQLKAMSLQMYTHDDRLQGLPYAFRTFLRKIFTCFEQPSMHREDIKELLCFIFEYYSYKKFYSQDDWFFDCPAQNGPAKKSSKAALLGILDRCAATRLVHTSDMRRLDEMPKNYRRLIDAIIEKDYREICLLQHCLSVQEAYLAGLSGDEKQPIQVESLKVLKDLANFMQIGESGCYGQDFDRLVRTGAELEVALGVPESACMFCNVRILRDMHVHNVTYDKENEDDEKSALAPNGGHFSQDRLSSGESVSVCVPAGLMNDPRARYDHKVVECNDITHIHKADKPCKGIMKELATDQAVRYVEWVIKKDPNYRAAVGTERVGDADHWIKGSTLFPSCFRDRFAAYAMRLCAYAQKATVLHDPIGIIDPLFVGRVVLKETRANSKTVTTNIYSIKHLHSFGCCEKGCLYADRDGDINVTMIVRTEKLGKFHTVTTILSMYPEL